MDKNTQIFQQEVLDKLDKIIELLEFRNSIEKARKELINPNYAMSPWQPFEDLGQCCCSQKGETSAVITCPIHDKPRPGIGERSG